MKKAGLCSEYNKLRKVLLYRPGPEISNHPDPHSILHLRPIDYAKINLEFTEINKAYSKAGVEVLWIDSKALSDDRNYLYNMIYCRDLFFMTPYGAIIANMANDIRRSEPLYAERALLASGTPILHTVFGEGRFEGADALWITEDLVLVGVGNRTNLDGFEQIKMVLEQFNIQTVAIPSYQTKTQHLLGSLQIVDRNLALVRSGIVATELCNFLESRDIRIIDLPENSEITTRQAMNVVVVAPSTIFMSSECKNTKTVFVKAGLKVAAEIDLTQLISGAGGLACATAIMARVQG